MLIAGFEDQARLATCHALGFADTYDLSDPSARMAFETAASGADLVIKATGRPSSIHDVLSLLRSEGVLVLAGIYARSVTLAPTHLVRRKLQIRGTTHGTQRHDWDAALAEDAAAFAPMITHRLPLSQIEGGARDAKGRLEGHDPAGRLSVTFRRAEPACG